MAMFNPFLPSFMRDPYRAYAALRSEEPVHRSMALEAWVVTGYEQCDQILRDHATFSSDASNARGNMAQMLNEQRLQSPLGQVATLLTSDPPEHTRLRGVINRGFTPRTVERQRSHIDGIAATLMERAAAGSSFDVMADLAQPLPVIVIAELLGVAPADRDLFTQWSAVIAGATNMFSSLEQIDEIRATTLELIDYFAPVIEQRRSQPRDDLISALVHGEEGDDDRLSGEEVLAFCILLLVAGNETTTNLIGNGTLALMANPQQQAALREQPALLSAAVEELARYDSPVQGVVRFALARSVVGGCTIEQGDAVLAMLGAANRDPARFSEPDVLDLRRSEARPLSYGAGIHACLGASLARMEAEIAIAALVRGFEALGPPPQQPERGGTFLLRGLRSLPRHVPVSGS